ncbi:iron-containing redox enzyme family protein [Microbacterium sp. M28]|uniref:iron-containing redox enzyme family protein n=1 Tax=Microbacterium sp. M28 TaxID=2962064 RepID=UPI0021F484BD|nr:iron-containing redox enzyme family protein [Microbacterium sp. M28]UYO97744.1 iron-containing redox enzyme family protein [Microbacterium sp. M28]
MSLTAIAPAVGLPFSDRGPLSAAVLRHLSGDAQAGDHRRLADEALARTEDVIRDDDIQLALFALYASAYGSIEAFSPETEWDPELIGTRRMLEERFEQALRAQIPQPDLPEPTADAVARSLFALTAADAGPSVSRHLARTATLDQAREFFIQRSVYTLREADPHSWAIPRLQGRAKAALVEIQTDEYGGGRPDRVHATIFAASMRGVGLDDTYAAYVDDVPAITLAALNMMSMFGLNRRLLGAIVGHLAAFEMTSSIPSRMYADGLRRLGFGEHVTDYFDEHVEADAVHEQIAARDLAGGLAEDRPDLLPDIMFGAIACLTVEGWFGEHLLDAWTRGESSLRTAAGS